MEAPEVEQKLEAGTDIRTPKCSNVTIDEAHFKVSLANPLTLSRLPWQSCRHL